MPTTANGNGCKAHSMLNLKDSLSLIHAWITEALQLGNSTHNQQFSTLARPKLNSAENF